MASDNICLADAVAAPLQLLRRVHFEMQVAQNFLAKSTIRHIVHGFTDSLLSMSAYTFTAQPTAL
jgi:hypothetical protein